MHPNLSLSYLHRDSGNYKSFGEVIFTNPTQLSPEQAERDFRRQLIDTEFFYCQDWNLPPLLGPGLATEGEWYEFVKFTPTEEPVTDFRSIEEFLETMG